MRSRTAWTSSGVMSVTPWSRAAWPATCSKMPDSSTAEKRALQPGMTSPQVKVFTGDSLSGWGGVVHRAPAARGWERLPRVLRGGQVLQAQQAEDDAGGVRAQHRV